MKNDKALVIAVIIATELIVTAATLTTIAVPAFADESETETEQETEQENNCSGFNYLCQGQATASSPPTVIVRPG